MTLCNGCGRPISAAEDPHDFGPHDRYHQACCPMCTTDLQPSEEQLVSMAKRGHRCPVCVAEVAWCAWKMGALG